MSGNALRITAILLFMGALLIGWYGLRTSQQSETVAPSTISIVRYSQVVARQDIPAGHVLKLEDLALEESETQNHLAYHSTAELIGRMVEAGVSKGSLLLHGHFPQRGAAAQLLKSGERGVAVKVDEVIGVGGFIQPGDHVDVLVYLNTSNGLSTESSAQSILRDVRVISYGETLQQSDPASSNAPPAANALASGSSSQGKAQAMSGHSAVLAVKEEDVARLMLAASGGTLRLSLRGAVLEQSSSASDFVRLSDIAGTKQKAVTPALAKPVRQLAGAARIPITSVVMHVGDKTETVNFKGQ
ncbi:Flp pilus assembly protein CpaB [Methylobacillus caricis]|uniref:Flp pilus assembly protein CpaB n=1 Tax=Methylobacillus caricis TaxID=1971611 RepID=UPI001CFFF552|nr:Flp pilus assembly protein CpaB [Methylobacillus caricis]MCB5187293.1 Flp pilus assembly protein CpaB [Methylobacillus caricis]